MLSALTAGAVQAADQPQWGQALSRNMVSGEKDLAVTFSPATGENIKWSARLGNQGHATPVIAGGKVLIGANNSHPRDPRHQGDRAVLMCFAEQDGRFCWQLVVPKLKGDKYKDWPGIGIVSAPTVEADRLYLLNNRREVMCLDLDGLSDGNDGPFTDEGRHMADEGEAPVEPTPQDADIIWLFDTLSEVGVYPHDSGHSSILVDGPFLYLNTANGVDNTHKRIPAPDAPSLIALDKATGRLAAADAEKIGPRILHCSWSSPALGEIAGRRLVIFGGGDGVVYAFEALQGAAASRPVANLTKAWWFDCDPSAPKENVHRYVRNRREGPSNVTSMPVFDERSVYVTVGGDVWQGKEAAWLKRIDASGAGDVAKSAEVWSYPLQKHCCSTPSISEGLVYVADCGGVVHCLDAATGRPQWTHELGGAVWGSTLVADGKVYVGTRRGQLWVFAAGKEKRVLACVELDSPMSGTPVAANGVLYVATERMLYAIERRAPAR